MERTYTFEDLLAALRRRRVLALVVFAAVLGVGLCMAALLPADYTASSTVQLEPRRLTADFFPAQGIVPIEDRMRTLKHGILARPVLERVVKETNFFPDLGGNVDEGVERLRRQVEVRLEGEVERQSREVNAARLLRKPVSVADFLEAVKKTLGEEIAEGEAVTRGVQKAKLKTAPIQRPASETLAASTSPEPELSLSDSLVGLRGSLGAISVLLLDDTGRVTAQAGDWPSSDLAALLVPDLMAGLSAAHKVSRQIGAALPDAVQAMRGQEYDLLVAPVGRYALLIFLKRGPGALRMALAFEEALLAQKQLARILSEVGLNILPIVSQAELEPVQEGNGETALAEPQAAAPEEELAEPPSEALQALAEMLDKPQPGPSAQDAEKFWDNLEAEEKPSPDNPDVRPDNIIEMRWLVQRGVVAIPKSVHPERIAENFAVFDFALPPADMDRIATLDRGESSFFSHRDPAFVKMIGGFKVQH